MDRMKWMRDRHSVRSFTDKPLEAEAVSALEAEIAEINSGTGLHFQLVLDEPEAFKANAPHYGKFTGCRNYLVLAGPRNRDEDIGYYGERMVRCAQEHGVNSCWVALTYRKRRAKTELAPGEKRYIVIALGYGTTQGTPHNSKKGEQISDLNPYDPKWYRAGIEAVLLAPSAMNQQAFRFKRESALVSASPGFGPCAKIDLGIAKYHFEFAAGKKNFRWLNVK